MIRVLFVCLGNICRSPTAEGVFRSLVREAGLEHAIETASAGTSAYHIGEGADPRSVKAARYRGYDLSAHSVRRVAAADFADFDYVVAMDRENLRNLRVLEESAGGAPARSPAKGEVHARLCMLKDFTPHLRFDEVPDPYSRGESGFELVLDIIEEGGKGLLEHIRATDLAAPRE